MMRWVLIALSALSLGACAKRAPDAAGAASAAPAVSAENATATYTIVRICEDGTKIYGPEPHAIWQENKWVNIEGSPASVCRKK